ncbi:MAG: hypothetical protein SGPRY_002691 [Prymnesium sp.]
MVVAVSAMPPWREQLDKVKQHGTTGRSQSQTATRASILLLLTAERLDRFGGPSVITEFRNGQFQDEELATPQASFANEVLSMYKCECCKSFVGGFRRFVVSAFLQEGNTVCGPWLG